MLKDMSSGLGREASPVNRELEREAMAIFNRADIDGDGVVSLEEWLYLFSAIDRDGNGSISRKEWHLANGTTAMYDRMSRRIKGCLTIKEWRDAFEALDVDRDGRMSIREWLSACLVAQGHSGNVTPHGSGRPVSPRQMRSEMAGYGSRAVADSHNSQQSQQTRKSRGPRARIHSPPPPSLPSRLIAPRDQRSPQFASGQTNRTGSRKVLQNCAYGSAAESLGSDYQQEEMVPYVGRLDVAWPPQKQLQQFPEQRGRELQAPAVATFCICGAPFLAYAIFCGACGERRRAASPAPGPRDVRPADTESPADLPRGGGEQSGRARAGMQWIEPSPRVCFSDGPATVHLFDPELPVDTHPSQMQRPLARRRSFSPPPARRRRSRLSNGQSSVQPKAKVSLAMARLQKVIADHDLMAKNVNVDSSGQFRAFADQLFRDESYHAEMRQKAIDQLSSCPDKYAAYVAGARFRQYLVRMSQPQTLGDDLSLQALADYFNVQVMILTSSQAEREIHVQPASADRQASEPIWLGLLVEDGLQHYVSLMRWEVDPALSPDL